jgi:hypothetical protein
LENFAAFKNIQRFPLETAIALGFPRAIARSKDILRLNPPIGGGGAVAS